MKSTSLILKEAKSAKAVLCSLDTKTKNEALLKMADALIENCADILTENYDVEHENALTDAKNFVEGLKKQGVLE